MTDLVFISVFNKGALEIATNHLESLRRNNISNYMAYVTDRESYDQLASLGYNVEKYESNKGLKNKGNDVDIGGIENYDGFGTETFNNFTYLRYNVINRLLNEGKTVWYMDVDTVVLGDINKYYNDNIEKEKYDILFQDDINMLCSGCMLYFNNPRNIFLTDYLFNQPVKDGTDQLNDQLNINRVLRHQFPLKITTINKNVFPNGLLYFNELSDNPFFRKNQEDFRKSTETPLFVHANYMIGMDAKIQALKDKNLWFLSKPKTQENLNV